MSPQLNLPSSLPQAHRRFLDDALAVLSGDSRLVGVAAGGSFIGDAMDEFSDLDLVVAVEPSQHAAVLAGARELAERLGSLLEAFTGDHVGEPRLLICLYGPPLLHVDLKFVALPDVAQRVEDPVILWQRDGRMSAALADGEARYPPPDRRWIEDRFWIWVHYAAVKVGRGELFEAIEFLSFLRVTVLGPLALQAAGARPSGVRRIESAAPRFAEQLKRTLAGHDAGECVAALRAAIDLYRTLRGGGDEAPGQAEQSAVAYLDEIAAKLSPAR
jgi:hypothetical protein